MAHDVVRQTLPLLAEEDGRDLYYLPDLPEEDPYAAGHRTCAGCGPGDPVPVGAQGGRPGHRGGRPHRLHVRGQLHLPVHAVHGAVGAHPDRQRRLVHLRHGGRIRGDDQEGPVPGPVPEHPGDGGRRVGRRHRHRVDLRRAVPRPRRAVHLLRQRVLRQHRHPDLADHAVRGHDHVHAVRQGDPRGQEAAAEEPGQDDGRGAPALLRGHHHGRLPGRPDEQDPQGPQPRGRRLPALLHAVPEGLGLPDLDDGRARPPGGRGRALPGLGVRPAASGPTATSTRRSSGR